MDRRGIVRALALLVVIASCDDSTDGPPRPSSVPPEATVDAPAPPAPPPLAAPATADSVYAAWLPPKLCEMQRVHIQPVLDVVTARYEKDDVRLHVNIGPVENLDSARGLYESQYAQAVHGPWAIYTRRWTLDTGEQNKEACIVIRNSIDVCLDIAAMREPPDPVPCLTELDLPGLVELAASKGAPSGVADLSFTFTEEQWKAHKASLEPGWSAYEKACELHAAGKKEAAIAALVKAGRDGDPELECRMLDETRRDCRSGAFDLRLAESNIHLTPSELENFRRTWDITCELALARKR